MHLVFTPVLRKFIPATELYFYNTCIPRLSESIQKVMMLFTPSSQDVPLWSQRWKTQGQVESEEVKVAPVSEYVGSQCEAEELGFQFLVWFI